VKSRCRGGRSGGLHPRDVALTSKPETHLAACAAGNNALGGGKHGSWSLDHPCNDTHATRQTAPTTASQPSYALLEAADRMAPSIRQVQQASHETTMVFVDHLQYPSQRRSISSRTDLR